MIITCAEKSKKNKDRMSIFIDGEFAFSMSEDDYLSMHLYDKSEITQEEIDYIQKTLNFNNAKAAAVKYLSLKLRTEKEVRVKLHESEFDRDTTDRVVEELKAIGYINNKLYAQKYVYDRSKLKPKSKKLLKLELQSRGIPGEIADEVLEDMNVEEDTVAEGLVRKKFGKYDLGDEAIISKIYMFLHHRGYSREIADQVIHKLKEEA